jgi:hypothetical protein
MPKSDFVIDANQSKFIIYNHLAPSVSRAFDRIARFKAFPPGWHFGKGIGSTDDAYKWAENLLCEASENGMYDVDAFPEINGDITVEVYKDNDTHGFTVAGENRVDYIHEGPDDTEISRETLPFVEAARRLYELRDKRWIGLGSSTSPSIRSRKSDSKTMLSIHSKVQYPSLTQPAYFAQAMAFVLMSHGIIVR